jgi:hypothetical protein
MIAFTRTLAAAAVLAAAALPSVGCRGGGGSYDIGGSILGTCSRIAGPVTVRNEHHTVIATAEASTAETGGLCEATFHTRVPHAAFYTVSIGGRECAPQSFDELKRTDFQLVCDL